jgi:tetratricopeptide (TPR) repeat protein
MDPHNVYALYNKGLALDNLGNHTGAIEYYDKALAIDPHDVNALANKGNALDKLGMSENGAGFTPNTEQGFKCR